MTQKEFKKIAQLLNRIYKELEVEALKQGVNLVSEEYDLMQAEARNAILAKFGFTIEEYRAAKEEAETIRRGERPSLEEVKTVAKELKDLPVLTKEQVKEIAHEVAKEYITAPQVINKIVKEIKIQTPPQVIKETIVNEITNTVEYDDTQLQKEIKRILQQIDEIKVPEPIDVEELRAKLQNDFRVFFEQNINVLDMPNFRKLAMGLQQQISDLGSGDSLPDQTGNNGKFLTTNGTTASWTTLGAGTGDVVGPSSAVDGQMAVFNGATGKVIKVFEPDSGSILIAGTDGVVTEDANLRWDASIDQFQVGSVAGTIFEGYSNYISAFVGDTAAFLGIGVQNLNSTDAASTDITVSADNDDGTIGSHYGDFGINSSGYVGAAAGVIKTVSVTAGGTGYTPGDELTLTTGDANAIVEVLTAPGGVVGTVSIVFNGTGYSTGAGQATTGGTGTGATINVASLFDYTGMSANDIYVLGVGGNLLLGSDDTVAGKTIKFFVGGFGSTHRRMELTSTALVPGTSDGTALGTTALMWSDLFLASGSVVNFNAGDVTLTHSSNTLTLGGGNLALGSNSLTMTGSIAATGSRVTKGWFTDVESTNMYTVGGTSLTTVAQTFQNKTMTNSNNVLGGVTMTLGSDADGDVYYRASGVLTRLAKGTAGQVLKMNAGATAPEWGAAGSGGYTNLTEFVDQTAWRVFYSNGSGDVTELALGADGTFLKSNGTTSAPSFATPAGSGDVTKVGTPANTEIGVWTGDGTLGRDANFIWSGTVQTIKYSAAATNVINYPLKLSHITSGTASTLGVGIAFEVENGEGTLSAIGNIAIQQTGGSESSEVSKYVVRLANGGTVADKFTVAGDGTVTTTAGIELGHASDTTITRVSAGVVAIEGVNILTTATGLALSGGTITGAINLGENAGIFYDAALSADGKYSGMCRAGTAGATLAFGDLVYLAAADSRWELTDADAASTAGDVLIGMCVLAAASDGDATTILLQGFIRADTAFPALTIGGPAYIGTTAGDIVTTAPTGTDDVVRRVGFAWTADELYFNPSMDAPTHV